MKQAERKQQTIAQLLAATKELIQEKGCSSITMKDIMERSKLSKGAIFHHVRSKDEIFAWVLQERLDEINDNFMRETEQLVKTFEGPMKHIAANLAAIESPHDITNRIVMYLLGKEGDPAVAEVLASFYERSVRLSQSWIAAGQQHGVIPKSVDAAHTAEMFVLLSLGLRVRSSIPGGSSAGGARSVSLFIEGILQRNDPQRGNPS